MPTIAGSISISDLVDGVTGATIVFSEEASTFTASADGEITDLSSFTTQANVYAGTTQHTYASGTTPGANEFSFGTITFTSGADLDFDVSSDGTISISDLGEVTTGFDDPGTEIDAVAMTVPVIVNISGTAITYNRVVSLTKARGGSAKIVSVAPSRQAVLYDFAAVNPKSTEVNIVLTADYQNYDTGDAAGTWSFRSGASGTFSAITATQGAVSGTNNSILTITPAQYQTAASTNDVVTYRVTRDTRIDQVSIVKIRDAEGAYQVIITSTDSIVFKNNAGTTDLTATVFRGGLVFGAAPGGDDNGDPLEYAWRRGGEVFTPTVTQPENFGVTHNQIRIDAGDVPDGDTSQFTCNVTYNEG